MPAAHVKSINFTPHFLKSFSKLPLTIQELAKKKDGWFRRNPFDPRLRTHKLKGKLSGAWAYSVSRGYRVLFRFLDGDEVIYYDVGTHDIYR
ncbi:MAG: Plasmid stabilization system [Parcubacteria group bacterium GW2011_GWA2_43_17]|nr:MAG: Plasmid stabilization system [Parcubacteria group bacterium GW2011_GWA2_43_17]KKT89946.1 MAG: Plasmid stabilization system [Parcubacteria group bacterium GW2011_GWF2_45_11]